jgi:hypothetical protein
MNRTIWHVIISIIAGRLGVQVIQSVMPPIFEIKGPELQSSEDFPLPLNLRTIPPMIAFEKGESLEDLVTRRPLDFVGAVQVRLVVCECLGLRCHALAAFWSVFVGGTPWKLQKNLGISLHK